MPTLIENRRFVVTSEESWLHADNVQRGSLNPTNGESTIDSEQSSYCGNFLTTITNNITNIFRAVFNFLTCRYFSSSADADSAVKRQEGANTLLGVEEAVNSLDSALFERAEAYEDIARNAVLVEEALAKTLELYLCEDC